jgi:hypothetical protein
MAEEQQKPSLGRRQMLPRGKIMDWVLGLIPDISLERANQFYTWGWTFSLLGALITFAAVLFLMWGTRVRDHDFENQMGNLNSEAGNARERAGILEKRAAELEGETLQLKSRLAWRRISKEQHDRIVAELSNIKAEIAVTYPMGDAEAAVAASDIIKSLKDSGISIKGNGASASMFMPTPPFGIIVTQTGTEQIAHPIAKALVAAGISVKIETGAKEFSLIVGSRPSPF